MSDVEERRFGDLVLKIDRLLCVGFGDCMDEAPGVFEFDDDGVAVFTDDPGELGREALVATCESCPVDALILENDQGEVLAP